MLLYVNLTLIVLILLTIKQTNKYKKLLNRELKKKEKLKCFIFKLENNEFKDNEAQTEFLEIVKEFNDLEQKRDR